jgi:hypothetical protein
MEENLRLVFLAKRIFTPKKVGEIGGKTCVARFQGVGSNNIGNEK